MIPVKRFQLNTNILNLGALLGTSGSQDVMNNLVMNSGSGSFFGSMEDPYRTGFQSFMSTVIDPIRQVSVALDTVSNKMKRPDVYRPITTVKDLENGIPPCMHLGIIYYPPIRTMMEEERIDAFGFTPEDLNEGDMFKDILNNGYTEIHSSLLDDNGCVAITRYEGTGDPDLTSEEISSLRETREFIDEFIVNPETNYLDFTSYPSLKC